MSPREMYEEIEKHLLQDEKPSKFLERAVKTEIFSQMPYDLLKRMKKTEQSPRYHPEGNVWIHTMMVTDAAAERRKDSRDERVFMWAVLLHDIGKPLTTRFRKGRITSYNHDVEGERLARRFLETFSEDKMFVENVCGLVRYHMQILFVTKEASRAQLEEMKRRVDIRDAALLGFCDRIGRVGVDRELERENVRAFLQACGVSDLDIFKW